MARSSVDGWRGPEPGGYLAAAAGRTGPSGLFRGAVPPSGRPCGRNSAGMFAAALGRLRGCLLRSPAGVADELSGATWRCAVGAGRWAGRLSTRSAPPTSRFGASAEACGRRYRDQAGWIGVASRQPGTRCLVRTGSGQLASARGRTEEPTASRSSWRHGAVPHRRARAQPEESNAAGGRTRRRVGPREAEARMHRATPPTLLSGRWGRPALVRPERCGHRWDAASWTTKPGPGRVGG